MKRFAELLDRLAYEPARNNKLRLITDYFRSTPDPDRGWALAALTGALSFQHAKPGIIRTLIAERADPVLFGLSYDYVGDLSETVALMWPVPSEAIRSNRDLTLSDVVDTLSTLGKAQLPGQLARWLDVLDETGRWALLKLVTGGLRIGVSARLAKTAAAALGNKDATGDRADLAGPEAALCRPVRLARRPRRQAGASRPGAVPSCHAGARGRWMAILPRSIPADFMAEWKWDGIRVQAVADVDSEGRRRHGSIRAPARISPASFPDLAGRAAASRRDRRRACWSCARGACRRFNVLQQRLNRKTVNAKLLAEFPAHLRAYDLLVDGADDLREQPFATRRAPPRSLRGTAQRSRVDLSPLIPFATWDELAAARANPTRPAMPRRSKASCSSAATRPIVPGRPKGLWWKWKRDPHADRCRADVCPARSRQALVLLFRLYLRGLDDGHRRRRTRTGGQGLFRLYR